MKEGGRRNRARERCEDRIMAQRDAMLLALKEKCRGSGESGKGKEMDSFLAPPTRNAAWLPHQSYSRETYVRLLNHRPVR